jgi:hypothetical protein
MPRRKKQNNPLQAVAGLALLCLVAGVVCNYKHTPAPVEPIRDKPAAEKPDTVFQVGGPDPTLQPDKPAAEKPDAAGRADPTLEPGKSPAIQPKHGGPVQVHGYTRSDGTYVAPHTRAAPGAGRGGRR